MTEVLRIGDNVFIPRLDNKYFQVAAVEPFTYGTGESATAEFSSTTTGSNTGFVNVSVLEPDDRPRRLFQVWLGVRDGCTYFVKLPVGTDRWGVDEDKDVGFIDNDKAPYFAKNKLYEFWLVHDTYPAIKASNATGTTLTPKVYFEGLKYTLQELGQRPAVFRTVLVGGPEQP